MVARYHEYTCQSVVARYHEYTCQSVSQWSLDIMSTRVSTWMTSRLLVPSTKMLGWSTSWCGRAQEKLASSSSLLSL